MLYLYLKLIFFPSAVARNRMGRLLTFMARIRKDNNIKNGVITRGVGVDEHTALLLDVQTGDIQTVGVGTAYVCSTDHAAEICVDSVPLTFHGKRIYYLIIPLSTADNKLYFRYFVCSPQRIEWR